MSFPESSIPEAKNTVSMSDFTDADQLFDHVMTFGTFDIFHPGHLFYLLSAQNFAKKMTVVIARDHRVFSGKGKDPLYDERKRQKVVQENFPNARVILGDENDIFAPIRELTPDVLIFGYDQRVPLEKIHELFPTIEVRRVGGFETDTWKSSKLRDKHVNNS